MTTVNCETYNLLLMDMIYVHNAYIHVKFYS